MRKKFAGQFDRLTKFGPTYRNDERFRALRNPGKPLWEFKQHDHRLYCYRNATINYVEIVLFNGWAKDKEGKTDREAQEIKRALSYYNEFLTEYPGGKLT